MMLYWWQSKWKGEMYIFHATLEKSFKDEILTQINETFNGFKIVIITERREHIKQEVSDTVGK